MRGDDCREGSSPSLLSPDWRLPPNQPFGSARRGANDPLRELDSVLDDIYGRISRKVVSSIDARTLDMKLAAPAGKPRGWLRRFPSGPKANVQRPVFQQPASDFNFEATR